MSDPRIPTLVVFLAVGLAAVTDLRRFKVSNVLTFSPHPDDECIGTGAEVASHRLPWRDDERLTEKIERSIHEEWRRRIFSESLEQLPKQGIGGRPDHMQPNAVVWRRFDPSMVSALRFSLRRPCSRRVPPRRAAPHGDPTWASRFAQRFHR